MKRTILLIAIIVCASCSLRASVENMRHKMEEQYNKLYKQQNAVQELAAAAAAKGAAADPQAVVETLDGLTEAAKFWGTFIGNEVFNTNELQSKIKILEAKRTKLEEYASTDGTQALVQLNQAIWSVATNVKDIQALATQLKKGAENVQQITQMAFQDGVEEMQGNDKAVYQAAIKVLYNTLNSAVTNTEACKENLNTLSLQLIAIESTMESIAGQLQNTADGKSKEFDQWVKDMRAKVYGGCVASIICPECIIPCYAIAAGVLESKIAQYKRETNAFVDEFTTYSQSFTAISTMAGEASHVSKEWYGKTVDFEAVIKTEYTLIEGTQDILYMKQAVRDMINDSLNDLIAECEKVIEDTTGQLDGNVNSEKTNDQELIHVPDEAMIDGHQMIHQLCNKIHFHSKAKYERCVKAARTGLTMLSDM